VIHLRDLNDFNAYSRPGLIHLELSDVAMNSVHLAPNFTKGAKGGSASASTSTTATPSKPPPASKLVKKPCPDCKSVYPGDNVLI
jgi:hypothetical protein